MSTYALVRNLTDGHGNDADLTWSAWPTPSAAWASRVPCSFPSAVLTRVNSAGSCSAGAVVAGVALVGVSS
jgi:hypothetical protein